MVAIPTFLFHIVLDVGIIGRLAVESVRNGGILSFIYRLSFIQQNSAIRLISIVHYKICSSNDRPEHIS